MEPETRQGNSYGAADFYHDSRDDAFKGVRGIAVGNFFAVEVTIFNRRVCLQLNFTQLIARLQLIA